MSFTLLKKKTVLITGINGFIGSGIAKAFVEKEAIVHGTIRTTSTLDRILEIEEFIKVHFLELSNGDKVHSLLQRLKPDYIIHAAHPSAYKLELPNSFENQIFTTTQIAHNILNSALEVKPEKIIHCCSAALYGINNKTPFSEKEEPMPDSKRGLVKLNERNIFKYYAQKHNLPVVMARIFRAYGPWDSNKKLIVKALEHFGKGIPLSLSTKSYTRDYIFIEDLAQAILKICVTKLPNGSELNIGSGDKHSARKITGFMEDILGEIFLVSQIPYPTNYLDKVNFQADITNTKTSLEWKPKTSILEGLRKTIYWYKNRSGSA
jgi:UDP-glucose 4-epimerase